MSFPKSFLAASLAAAGVVTFFVRAAHADPAQNDPAHPDPTPYVPEAPPPGEEDAPIAAPSTPENVPAATPSTQAATAPAPAGSKQLPMVYVPTHGYGYVSPATISSYEEGDPIPDGYHPEKRRRTGLVIAGSVMFGTMYGASLLFLPFKAMGVYVTRTTTPSDFPTATFFIPVAGPFIEMTNTDDPYVMTFAALDGIVQAAGLALLLVGVASPTEKTVLVRNPLGKVDVRPVPVVTGNTMGAGLAGTF